MTWISGKYVHRKIKLRGARKDVEIIHASDALVYFYPKTFCITILPTGKGMIIGEPIHFGPDSHWPIELVCECRNNISIHRWLAGYRQSDET